LFGTLYQSSFRVTDSACKLLPDINAQAANAPINTLFRRKRDVDANDGGITVEIMWHAIDADKGTTARGCCCRAQAGGPAASDVD
jgi:hypothetical protein